MIIPCIYNITIISNKYDVTDCHEAVDLNNESMDLYIEKNSSFLCYHMCCCKYTG